MAVATYEDVAVALGRPISDPAEQAQVTYWLDGIEMVIVSRLGPVSELDQDILRFVETEAVAARVRRYSEGGASSITVAVDDGTVTRRYEGAISSGDITAEWWDMLNPVAGSGVFSARPQFEPDLVDPSLDWS